CGPAAGRDAATGAPPRIPLLGDGTNPVVSITGNSNVTLANLEISGGRGADNLLAGGGGIAINGSAATVALQSLDIHDNQGGFGGGVAIYGDGKLTLHGVTLRRNHASG